MKTRFICTIVEILLDLPGDKIRTEAFERLAARGVPIRAVFTEGRARSDSDGAPAPTPSVVHP
jgi:hypothetical protein